MSVLGCAVLHEWRLPLEVVGVCCCCSFAACPFVIVVLIVVVMAHSAVCLLQVASSPRGQEQALPASALASIYQLPLSSRGSGRAAFGCHQCTRVDFTSARVALDHVLSVHLKVPRFPCASCGRVYCNRSSLSMHRKRTSCGQTAPS